MTDTIQPHPNNSPGPFYVVYGCCTACGVPFVEAPGHFANDANDHCFVQRQPENKDELNRMLRAARAAELQCIRYRGQDPEVHRRLCEIGELQLCDDPPPGIRAVFRNHVSFDAASPEAEAMTPQELIVAFQNYLRSLDRPWLIYDFAPIVADRASAAFSYSWYQSNFHSLEIHASLLLDCRWLIRHSPVEQPGSRGVSNDLDDWLKHDARFCKIRWYTDEQWNDSREWQDTPW